MGGRRPYKEQKTKQPKHTRTRKHAHMLNKIVTDKSFTFGNFGVTSFFLFFFNLATDKRKWRS